MATSIVSLSCPNCGGKLDLTPDIERFACIYCGKEMIVNRGGGMVSLKPVVEKLEQMRKVVEQGTRSSERVADELLLQRVEKERQAAESNFPEEWRRLDKLRANAGNNQLLGFAAIAGGLAIGGLSGLAALGALTRGIQGQAGLAEMIGAAIVDVLFAAGVVGIGALLGWAFLSAWRRQSRQVQAQQQGLRSRLEQLRREEADVRRRLESSRV